MKEEKIRQLLKSHIREDVLLGLEFLLKEPEESIRKIAKIWNGGAHIPDHENVYDNYTIRLNIKNLTDCGLNGYYSVGNIYIFLHSDRIFFSTSHDESNIIGWTRIE